MDKIVSALSKNGTVACYAIRSTDLVARAEHVHKTSAVVTAALGRLLTATSLIGYQLHGKDQTVTVRVKGDGPVGALITVSDAEGNVRGYVDHPVVELPLNDLGKLPVGEAVGKNGILQVMRDMGPHTAEPFIGSVPLVSGEIAEDITSYFAHSEQIPTVCALGVLVNTDLSVAHAGGFIAQLLPGATEEDIQRLEENIQNIAPVTTLFSEGKTPEDIVNIVLEGLEPRILEEKPVEYRCNCTRSRVEKILLGLGAEDLLDLAETQPVTEVDCHFCPKIYRFNPEELRQLAEIAAKAEAPEETGTEA